MSGQTQQGGTHTPSQQPSQQQGQMPSGSQQQGGSKPIYRDWAAI